MFIYRFITSSILLAMVLSALFVFSYFFFILILCFMSAWEWGRLAGLCSKAKKLLFSFFCVLLLSIIMFFIQSDSSMHFSCNVLYFKYIMFFSLIWWLCALFLVLYYPSSAILWRTSSCVRLLFGIFIILPCLLDILVLRQQSCENNHFVGALWLLYVMILVWSVDTGSYIFGNVWGKHKLAPKISPNKTWEGLLGGVLLAVLFSLLSKKYFLFNVTIFNFFISSSASIVASIVGDLFESVFKREVGVKDSGYLLPGHGGILDRMDSLTAAVPIFFSLMSLFFDAI